MLKIFTEKYSMFQVVNDLFMFTFVSEIVKFQLIGKMLLNGNPERLVFKFLQMRTIAAVCSEKISNGTKVRHPMLLLWNWKDLKHSCFPLHLSIVSLFWGKLVSLEKIGFKQKFKLYYLVHIVLVDSVTSQ